MINRVEDLDAFIERAAQHDSIALDTEFVWERTFFPRLGLIQAALPTGECVLIDPLAFDSLASLGTILENQSITKILHDSTQDLQILYSCTGSLPLNVFDTRLVAGFAGMASTISLQNLLSELLDIDIPKGESRTNWLRRPLTDNQLIYAIDDVKYMHQIKDALEVRVRESGVESWLAEDLAALNAPELYLEMDLNIAYKRVKYFSYLNRREMALLRELAAWRDTAAMNRDIPRRHLIPDDALISLAKESPSSLSEFNNSKLLHKRERKYATDIWEAIQKGRDIPENECPTATKAPKNRNLIKRKVQRIKLYIEENIVKYNVDPQLVGSRAEFEKLADPRQKPDPDDNRLLRGWRKEFLGEKELEALGSE